VTPEIGGGLCKDFGGIIRNVATVIADIPGVGFTSSYATDEIVELDDCVNINP
jgi:hypothetical protein